MTELAKYQGIYGHKAYAFYGHSNHGGKALELVSQRLRTHGNPLNLV